VIGNTKNLFDAFHPCQQEIKNGLICFFVSDIGDTGGPGLVAGRCAGEPDGRLNGSTKKQ
jgi:hypothetical protein